MPSPVDPLTAAAPPANGCNTRDGEKIFDEASGISRVYARERGANACLLNIGANNRNWFKNRFKT